MFAILSIVNLIDRLLIDEYWVGHTKAWKIPGKSVNWPSMRELDMMHLEEFTKITMEFLQ